MGRQGWIGFWNPESLELLRRRKAQSYVETLEVNLRHQAKRTPLPEASSADFRHVKFRDPTLSRSHIRHRKQLGLEVDCVDFSVI